jgi:ethanolamine utilization protein EutN
MQRAKVVGHATATIKHPTLAGFRLLAVQPLGANDSIDGEPCLSIDWLGASTGDKVLLTTDAVLIREMVQSKHSPIRFAVMGLLDEPE